MTQLGQPIIPSPTGYVPLPNQYAGSSDVPTAFGNGVGVNPQGAQIPAYLSDPGSVVSGQTTSFAPAYNNAMQMQENSILPLMNSIRGTTAAAQGVAGPSGTVSNQILTNLWPGMNQNAYGTFNSGISQANALKSSLAEQLAAAALARNPYISPLDPNAGNGNSPTQVNPFGNLDPSGILGGIGSMGKSFGDALTAMEQQFANDFNSKNPLPSQTQPGPTTINVNAGSSGGGSYPPGYTPGGGGSGLLGAYPAIGSTAAGPNNVYQYTQGGNTADPTGYVGADSGGLAGNLPNNYPYQYSGSSGGTSGTLYDPFNPGVSQNIVNGVGSGDNGGYQYSPGMWSGGDGSIGGQAGMDMGSSFGSALGY